MTDEDKQLICEYMGWTYHVTDDGKWWNCIGPKGGNHLLDLNDAGLCVEKMVENIIDWNSFLFEIAKQNEGKTWSKIIATVFMNADNFFQAMAEWLRQK